jgi:hypothetical protein
MHAASEFHMIHSVGCCLQHTLWASRQLTTGCVSQSLLHKKSNTFANILAYIYTSCLSTLTRKIIETAVKRQKVFMIKIDKN